MNRGGMNKQQQQPLPQTFPFIHQRDYYGKVSLLFYDYKLRSLSLSFVVDFWIIRWYVDVFKVSILSFTQSLLMNMLSVIKRIE
jgi:hypothetical protein